MELNIEDLLDKVSEKLKSLASTDTVIGEEFTIGEYTCKPVIKVGTGFGSGVHSGELNKKYHGKGTGGGVGAGIGVIPLGFLVTRKDEISFIAVDKKTALSTLFEKVPDLVEKMADMKEKKEGKDEAEKKEK